MLIACWSAKGGSGTTVVACALALVLAERAEVVIADLAGDVPAVLGLGDDTGPGLSDWVAAPDVGPEGLDRLQVDAVSGVRVLRRGRAAPGWEQLHNGGGERLAAGLAGAGDHVVADCGVLAPDSSGAAGAVATAVAAAAGLSLLVIRPCYLALRRALVAPVRASAAVVVCEPGRSLHAGDVEAVLDTPVKARVPVDPVVARAVDAGLLAGRVPARLSQPLRRALR